MQYSIPRPVFNKLEKTLVTRELFEEKFDSMESYANQRFISLENQIDHRLISMENQMDQRFRHLEEKMEERFKRTDFKFHVLIGISVFGFTAINPEFLNLIKLILK